MKEGIVNRTEPENSSPIFPMYVVNICIVVVKQQDKLPMGMAITISYFLGNVYSS